jgi:hypothetical protein
MECPRCQQGNVQSYLLRFTGEVFQVCDECEASWLPSDVPTVDHVVQLFEIFEHRGLPESWAELEVMTE